MSIEIKNVSKSFGKFLALENVSLTVPTAGLVALLGPSGCGKTTLLRIIAGMESPDSGTILFNGDDATNKNTRDRRVGFVFQHYALFRHMTVFENVAFGLRVKPRKQRPSEAQISNRVMELLALVQLDSFANHHPAQLSGGQRQRIALIRALAVEPRILLLDEPFGALDAKVRKELRRWLRRLHNEMQVTTIFVTHDQEEALEVSDSVVVLNKGRVEQMDTPSGLYDHPSSPFVYQFLGDVNLFHGRVHNGRVQFADGELEVEAPELLDARHAAAVGYARPYEMDFQRLPSEGSRLAAKIVDIRTIGPLVRLQFSLLDSGEIVEAELTRERQATKNYRIGETLLLKPRNLKVFLSPDNLAFSNLGC